VTFADTDLLPLSALQHYIYCPRQCALIHVEQQWSENRFTAEGRAQHDRVDRPPARGAWIETGGARWPARKCRVGVG
jgi:CRISPR-associated exonuclease Cas4